MQVVPFPFVTNAVQAKEDTLLNYTPQHSMRLLKNRSPGFTSLIALNRDPVAR